MSNFSKQCCNSTPPCTNVRAVRTHPGLPAMVAGTVGHLPVARWQPPYTELPLTHCGKSTSRSTRSGYLYCSSPTSYCSQSNEGFTSDVATTGIRASRNSWPGTHQIIQNSESFFTYCDFVEVIFWISFKEIFMNSSNNLRICFINYIQSITSQYRDLVYWFCNENLIVKHSQIHWYFLDN